MNKKQILILILCLLPLLSCAREVDVLSINDLHGHVMSYGKNLGMAKLATVVKDAVKHNPNTVVVFAGDNYAGSPITEFFHGAPVNDLIRELHVYGPELAIGGHSADTAQHKGYGRNLIAAAECIARDEYGADVMAILSGVGARAYYAELGYQLNSGYMVKPLKCDHVN